MCMRVYVCACVCVCVCVCVQSEDTRSSALHEAASANSVGCVQRLLGAGARLDLINGVGETPFECSMLHDIKK